VFDNDFLGLEACGRQKVGAYPKTQGKCHPQRVSQDLLFAKRFCRMYKLQKNIHCSRNSPLTWIPQLLVGTRLITCKI
jgi:hypothetical protein